MDYTRCHSVHLGFLQNSKTVIVFQKVSVEVFFVAGRLLSADRSVSVCSCEIGSYETTMFRCRIHIK